MKGGTNDSNLYSTITLEKTVSHKPRLSATKIPNVAQFFNELSTY